jgi:serine/threonine protein kinase
VIDERYRVEALLGQGGMGFVYQATHVRLGKSVAIKVLRTGGGEQNALARFQREAESASAIGNAHIVDISDFGTLEDGSTYFVMELLRGTDLIHAIEEGGRMPPERACRIATQVCQALGAAHDAGIVHRDLKPENIFLIDREDNPDFVKVLDFGIAKVANGPDRLTRANDFLGTPHYMSPEQCEGTAIDQRTDIYALGVLLYEMVAARVPHDADTAMGILHKHVYERPTPIKTYVPDIPSSLERIILRCIEKKPPRRYQAMREVQADLERFQREQQSGPPPVRGRPFHAPVGIAAIAAITVFGALAVRALSSEARPEPSTAEGAKPVLVVDAVRGVPELLTRPESEPTPTNAQALAVPSFLRAPDGAPGANAKPRTQKRVRRKPPKTGNKVSSAKTPEEDDVLDPWL